MNGNHSEMPPSMDTPERNNSVDQNGDGSGAGATNLVATTAADLIRQLDSAFSDMTMHAVAGARDAEAARSNARVASELARRFSSANKAGAEWTEELPSFAEPMQAPPAPSSLMYNGDASPFKSPPKTAASTTAATRQEVPLSDARQQRLNKTAERMAQSHTEDLLQVSLELERTKQQLEHEQMGHDETKSALAQSTKKNGAYEAQIDKLLMDMETARETSGRQLDLLQEDLARSQAEAVAANEDAELAVDVAKSKDADKAEMEEWLLKAMQEVQRLKEIIADSHIYGGGGGDSSVASEESKSVDSKQQERRRVRWEDEQVVLETPREPSRPTRALVAAGRQVLQRSFSTDKETPFTVSRSGSSAERRQRFRDRLANIDTDEYGLRTATTPSPFSARSDGSAAATTSSPRRNQLGSAVGSLDICRNAAAILKESGARLNLSGRWFGGPTTPADEIHLETLARHYTSLVEVQLDRKHKEVMELESLVSLWEEGVSPLAGPDADDAAAAATADEKSPG